MFKYVGWKVIRQGESVASGERGIKYGAQAFNLGVESIPDSVITIRSEVRRCTIRRCRQPKRGYSSAVRSEPMRFSIRRGSRTDRDN